MRTTRNFSLGRKFIADEATKMHYGLGVSVDFAAFTDARYGQAGARIIPAGTVVGLNAQGLATVPAADAAPGSLYLLASDALERTEQGGSNGQVGLISGAQVYTNFLPDADEGTGELPAALIAGLGPTFRFQRHPDRFVPAT